MDKKFAPQCTTRAHLYREWARILEMCEGLEIKLKDGWKYAGKSKDRTPTFDATPSPEEYEFAVGIVEGKFVFRGDSLYYDTTLCCVEGTLSSGVMAARIFANIMQVNAEMSKCSWNPPKPKTVTIELPLNTAKYYASFEAQDISIVREACKKALENLK